MSDEKNKLFSEPIITSGDKFDQDYTIDNNGVDFNPDEESLYPDELANEPTSNIQTQEIPTKSLDDETKVVPSSTSSSDSDHKTYNTGDIFQTEPINNYQEAPIDKQNNYYTVNQKPAKDDYEDEPETSDTKWWIIGGIALIVLICLGWFLFFRAPAQTPPPTETKTEETETTVEEIPEEDTEDQNQNNNSGSNNSYQGSTNTSRPSGDTSNSGSSSGGLTNSNDNGDSNNDSSTGNEEQAPPEETTPDNSGETTSPDTSEDTGNSGEADNSSTTDTSTEQIDGTTDQDAQDFTLSE